MSIKVDDEAKLVSFLNELEGRLESVDVEYGETLWKKYSSEPHGDLDEIERRRSEIILNDGYFRTVKEWASRIKDEFLAKRVQAMERLFLSERVEALRQKFSCCEIGLMRSTLSLDQLFWAEKWTEPTLEKCCVKTLIDPNVKQHGNLLRSFHARLKMMLWNL